MKIEIKVIPHQEQRYDTCGDWWIDADGSWQVRVSELSDWRYQFLIGFHELFEMAWCQHNNVSEEAVSDYDMFYERNRPDGDYSEPGDNPRAPYYWGHLLATAVERMVAACLGVKWAEYELEINNLEYVK